MDRSCIKRDSDDIHAERKEQSFESELEEYKSLRDKAYRKEKIIPCKSFNDNGFCNNNSGHLDQFGKRTLHICKVCYYKRGQKCDHSATNCNVVDEPCVNFNDGDCMFQSGHLSYDGKYSRHHICSICIVEYEAKRYHPAIECRHNENLKKCPNNAPKRERIHEVHDSQPNEKPCGFFNTKGRCRYPPGHVSRSRGFMKQVHICSCCLEFLGEARAHPAIDCDLKKRILGGGRKNFINHETKELACDAFNFSHCSLQSGHSLLSGDRRAFHICKICFEYRGEKNFHTKNECMLKKKLLLELGNESQTKYRSACTKRVMSHVKPSENDKIKIKTPKDINILVSFTKKGGTESAKNKQNENKFGNDKLKVKASKELTDIQSAKVSEVSQAIVKVTPDVSQAIGKPISEGSQAVPKTIYKVSKPVVKALHKVSRSIGKAVPEVNQPVEKDMTKTIPPISKAIMPINDVSQPVFKVCLIKRKASNVQGTCAPISQCKHFKRADGTMNTSGSKLDEVIKPGKTFL